MRASALLCSAFGFALLAIAPVPASAAAGGFFHPSRGPIFGHGPHYHHHHDRGAIGFFSQPCDAYGTCADEAPAPAVAPYPVPAPVYVPVAVPAAPPALPSGPRIIIVKQVKAAKTSDGTPTVIYGGVSP